MFVFDISGNEADREEEDLTNKVLVVTAPCRIERCQGPGAKDLKRSKSSIQATVFDLFKGFSPGSDLTRLQLPPQFNLPKSQLQAYGESVYCCAQDLLGMCTAGATPLDRFLAVVRWHISTTRPAPFARAPYNPILGETHHVSVGDLNVLCEQVSHHPPVSALYATSGSKKLQLLWWHHAVPRFCGNGVEITILGQRQLKLTEHHETYETSSPKLFIRFFPMPANEWLGNTTVRCIKSGLEASVSFKGRGFFGFRGSSNRVSGKIWEISTKRVLYELNGSWDKVVTVKNKHSGEICNLYDAQDAIVDIHAPVVENMKGVSSMESVNVWSDLTDALINGESAQAMRETKRRLEEMQRELEQKRHASGIVWTPKHFRSTKEGNWVWHDEAAHVPCAPLVVK
ncbi:unnamed protein product [Sphagnum compactum]